MGLWKTGLEKIFADNQWKNTLTLSSLVTLHGNLVIMLHG